MVCLVVFVLLFFFFLIYLIANHENGEKACKCNNYFLTLVLVLGDE